LYPRRSEAEVLRAYPFSNKRHPPVRLAPSRRLDLAPIPAQARAVWGAELVRARAEARRELCAVPSGGNALRAGRHAGGHGGEKLSASGHRRAVRKLTRRPDVKIWLAAISQQSTLSEFTGALHMFRAAVVVLLIALLPLPLRAQARIALLIGRLANPHNDVALLQQALKGLGFDVVVERDAGLGALTRAVNAYARRLQAAGPNAVGFFYYSGHGASDGNANYLIPVDVKTTETGELWVESLQLTGDHSEAGVISTQFLEE